jgi:cytochrome c peroxidase
VLKVETGIGPMEVPVDNPITDDKVALGKMLFFDKRLGKDNKMSCETCHLPEKGWTDAKTLVFYFFNNGSRYFITFAVTSR